MMTTRQILSKFRVYPNKNVFQVGCSAAILNIHAQQQRAFNLVWALLKTPELADASPIAVIGAGISGITVAAALASAGRDVHLYDAKNSVIHLQAGNQTRFLHPNIAVWPDKSFGYPLTSLPFLNWRAETAGHVTEQLLRQWVIASTLFKGNLDTSRLGYFVQPIKFDSANPGGILITTKLGTKRYGIVIVTVGYGIEQPKKSNTKSYWRNDDIAQPIVSSEKKRSFLVSGVGDGGLIDTLRLTIDQFHHQRFIQAVMNDVWLMNRSKQLKTQADWQTFITSKKIRVTKPSFLNLLRNDTKVYLNARSPFPSQAESQILHRLCVALLIRQGVVDYIEGDFVSANPVGGKKAAVTTGQKRVALIRGPAGYVRRHVDEVIERHNAEPSIEKLFPNDKGLLKRLRQAWRANRDETWRAQYPPGFLADELMPAHLECGYQVGFVLPSASIQDLRTAVQGMLAALGLRLTPEIQQWLNTHNKNYAVCATSHDCRFSLSVEEVRITEFDGNDPPNFPFSWRIFAPRTLLAQLGLRPAVPSVCLFLNTSSRRLVELLLKQDRLPYNVYRVYLSKTFDGYLGKTFPNGAPTPLVSFDTHSFLVNTADYDGRFFEVQSLDGLLTAHVLLRAPIMLEVLMNNWPTTKVHGIGWAIVRDRRTIRDTQAGNELLQWNP